MLGAGSATVPLEQGRVSGRVAFAEVGGAWDRDLGAGVTVAPTAALAVTGTSVRDPVSPEREVTADARLGLTAAWSGPLELGATHLGDATLEGEVSWRGRLAGGRLSDGGRRPGGVPPLKLRFGARGPDRVHTVLRIGASLTDARHGTVYSLDHLVQRHGRASDAHALRAGLRFSF